MPLPYQYQVHGPPLKPAYKKTGLNEHPAPQPDPTNPDRRVGLREWFRTAVAVAVAVLIGIVVVSGTLSLPQLIVLIAGSVVVIRLLRGRVKVPTISPSQRVDVATRALAGEDKSTLAQELDVPPEWVAEWARAFKEHGQSGVEGPAAPPLFDAGKWLSVLGPIIILTGLGVHISYYYYYWNFYHRLGLSPEEAGVSYADVVGRESVTIAVITGWVIFLVLVVAMGAWGLAKFTPPAIYTSVRELPRIIGPLGAAALLLFGGPFLSKKFDQKHNQSKKQVEDIMAGQIAGPYNDAFVNLPIHHVVLTGPRPTGPPAGQLMIRLGQANGITPILDPATGVLWRVPTATTPMVSSQSVFHLDLADPKANNTRPAISETSLGIKPDGTPVLDTGEKQFQLVGVRTSENCLMRGFFGDKAFKAFSEDSLGKGSQKEIEEIKRKARRAMKIVVFPIENDVDATTVDSWVFWASGGPALNVTLVQKGLASKGASARTPYGEVPATQKRLSC